MTTTEPEAGPAPDELAGEALEGADAEQHETEAQPVAEPARPAQLVRAQRDGSQQMIAGTELGVVPAGAELGQLAQMAVTIAAASTAPKALRGLPNDVFMVLHTARDLGVALTTAIREFHVIDGKVTLSPKVKLAMVRQQAIGDVYPHQAPRQVVQPDGTVVTLLCRCGKDDAANDGVRATWHAERHDLPGILHSSTYSLEMAGRVPAGKIDGKSITLDEKSTWQSYPERMLSWRALGYLLDDVFGEVGTGLYSPDEMGAVTDEEGQPIIDVVGQADPIPGTAAPRGHKAPPPPTASEETIAGLRKRIDALPADGRTALVALWTAGRDTDAGPKLPPLGRLLERQVKTADALVKSLEARAKKGEWGDWSPPADDPPAADAAGSPGDGPQSPSPEPAAAAPTEGAQPADGDSEADPPAGDAEQPASTESDAHDRLIESIIADVSVLTDGDVRAELDILGKSRNGTDSQVRRRLAMYRAKNAGVKVTEAEIKAATEGDA